MENKKKEKLRPGQVQARPGIENEMQPRPKSEPKSYEGGKLAGKTALITGGDSGIGRAVAILFAKEGARVAIVYLGEDEDAVYTKDQITAVGGTCRLIKADLSKEESCRQAVEETVQLFGGLDVLVNNAGTQWEQSSIEDISTEQLLQTFYTNFFSYFWMTKYAVGHLKKGAAIVNTTSVTAYRGSPALMDYAATKGAIVGFTRSLAGNLVKKGIRVNAVAPGPVWTPLIVSSFDKEKVASFGSDVPMERAGEPNEIAPCYVFLASEDASFMTGQVLHPNGGEIING
ncbi:SDR family oxidoreductase [Niabella pedocola]|uniref:SDR family oxidoreductase n=1 Tax=Niabella pedocola TaxID=1752077 RepID=A0ABS8PL05_9BACT|nr:SDR family oxidoreductase [Niabella pedocola]MCD2421555.1 SDR family oxidoreductase [Niabella pedocola]